MLARIDTTQKKSTPRKLASRKCYVKGKEPSLVEKWYNYLNIAILGKPKVPRRIRNIVWK